MRKLIAVAAIAAIAVFAACNAVLEPKNGDLAAVAGTYSLITMNGNTLPATFPTNTDSVTIIADVLTVNADGTWSELITFRQQGQPSNGTVTWTGTFIRSDAAVTFYQDQDIWFNGTFSGSTLNVSDQHYVFVFTR